MLKEDIKQYDQLLNRFKNLTSDNYAGAYEIAQEALVLSDRWNDIQLTASQLCEEKNCSKTELQKWAYGRYSILKNISEKCSIQWAIGEKEAHFFGGQAKRG